MNMNMYRAAIRLARHRTARERLSYPSGARAATGWYRELMGEKFPPPIAGMERAAVVDVHQMRTGRWSGSAQFLHEIGRNPSPVCPQCRDTKCEAARCPLCGEEADTPRHILMTCAGMMGVRLRIPAVGNILRGRLQGSPEPIGYVAGSPATEGTINNNNNNLRA